jgi:hypothetical protein
MFSWLSLITVGLFAAFLPDYLFLQLGLWDGVIDIYP